MRDANHILSCLMVLSRDIAASLQSLTIWPPSDLSAAPPVRLYTEIDGELSAWGHAQGEGDRR